LIGKDVEAPDLAGFVQPGERMGEAGFDPVAVQPGALLQLEKRVGPSVSRLGWDHHVGEKVHEQPADVGFEHLGKIVDGGEPQVVGSAAVKLKEKILCHRIAPAPARATASYASRAVCAVRYGSR
jgi:hypothetical protein